MKSMPQQALWSLLRYYGSGIHVDTLATYSDITFRLWIPTYADTRSFARCLLTLYHHWQRRNKTWRSDVLHHRFLSSPSGCLLSFITMQWQCGHKLCLLLPARWTSFPPCCVVVQPPLLWVLGQDIADQFCSNYCSLLSLKIIFSALHPLVLNPRFTELKKYFRFRYNSEWLIA